MLKTLGDFETLVKICRKQGVAEARLFCGEPGEVYLQFAPRFPKEPKPKALTEGTDAAAGEVPEPISELSDEDMALYSVRGQEAIE